jgi:hypothetical protein
VRLTVVLTCMFGFGAGACEHSAPFGPVASESGPFAPAPERLTFNIQFDQLFGFTTDGSEIFYTFCEDFKAEAIPPCGERRQPDITVVFTDRCLGALPATGGSRVHERCGSAHADQDSLKQYRGGTRLADGSLVFIYDARRMSASFSLSPALYVLRPGAPAPVQILAYTPKVDDLGIPSRILAAGGQRVVTLGGDGAELITINHDNTVTRVAIPPLMALDPDGTEGLMVSDANLFRVTLPSGTSQIFAPIPREGEWVAAIEGGFGFAADRAVVAQERYYVVGTTVRQEGRLVMLTSDGQVTEIQKDAEVRFGQVAVAPDGGSVVVERSGDLYRYTLP